MVFIHLPGSIAVKYQQRPALLTAGVIGLWRYGWWMIHVVRALLYAHAVYPVRRRRAARLWQAGWRPEQLHFMMTTFNELKETTEIVLQSIVDECRDVSIPANLFIGTGSAFDEEVISEFFRIRAPTCPIHVIIVRQPLPGKRYAIGATLRAIVQRGLKPDDPVVFMDGDTFFEPGCLRKCLPLFPLFPKMQALTTHERAIVLHGPGWMKKWLDMRFAQRHFTMQSYSLSGKILTLTGRMSVFRGRHLLEPGFTEVIENDRLRHWLWGEFRFLSGDDKSTWYYLLKSGADMMYVPDAVTTTIENITGNPVDRMVENLRRWCGNTLRNGARAIALGPRKVGFYIWWCLIDQRLSIWTMLAGHLVIVLLCLTRTPAYFPAALLWIAFSRLCASVILFHFTRRIDVTFPFFLYVNQLLSAVIKVYILFRLPRQKWKNRGDQQQGFEHSRILCRRNWVAGYLTLFYCAVFFLLVLLYLNLASMPTLVDIKMLGA